MNVHDIAKLLEKHQQRATYSAVAGIVGGIANGISQRLGEMNWQNSWIVAATTKTGVSQAGRPTGYRQQQIDPKLIHIIATDPRGELGLHPILKTGEELRMWIETRAKANI